MRLFLLCLLLSVLVCFSYGQPDNEQAGHKGFIGDAGRGTRIQPVTQFPEDLEADDHQPHRRQKRATCDLLSALNINHTACAAHCIARGYRGGYCNNQAVCNCRR